MTREKKGGYPPSIRPADLRASLNILTGVMGKMMETDLDPVQRDLMETGKAAAEDLMDRLNGLPDCGAAPEAPAPTAPSSGQARPVPNAPCEEPERRMSILLAEDNPLNRKLVVSLLRGRGHHAVVATNGREAVDYVRKAPFDLILMDIQMPVMDGFEATRLIREWERETGADRTPVIAVTAHVLEEEKERCFAMEMDGFVGKPIRRRDFLATVETIAGPSPLNRGAERDESPPGGRAILDRSALMSIVGGNRELIAELVDLYWQSLPKQMANIREALDDGNADQCQYWAHALKGMSLNLSARQTADIALEMELLGKEGDLSAGEAVWQRLRAAVDRLRRATDGMLNEMDLAGPG